MPTFNLTRTRFWLNRSASTLALLLPAYSAQAAPAQSGTGSTLDNLRNAATQAKFDISATDPVSIVSNIITAVLALVGVVFLILTIYGGIKWMTAGGNEEQVGDARKIIINSVIGIAVVMGAFAITLFVSTLVQSGTGFNAGTP